MKHLKEKDVQKRKTEYQKLYKTHRKLLDNLNMPF